LRPLNKPLVVNGWSIFAHPLFIRQVEALIAEVERARAKDPAGYARRNAAKRLAAIARLSFEIIPQDPARPEYRQGDTLGDSRKHWLRAKFFQQYRLFFRYSAAKRVIILAWVNDAHTLRAYDSASDAYRVFRRMLDRGTPPDGWDQLMAEAADATAELQGLTGRIGP
jgi:toxin YhaV